MPEPLPQKPPIRLTDTSAQAVAGYDGSTVTLSNVNIGPGGTYLRGITAQDSTLTGDRVTVSPTTGNLGSNSPNAGYGIAGLIYTATARVLIRSLGERGMVVAGGSVAGLMFVGLVLVPHWTLAIPCSIGLGLGFYLIHNTIQTRATEVAPEARGSAVSLYATGWALILGRFGAVLGLADTEGGQA